MSWTVRLSGITTVFSKKKRQLWDLNCLYHDLHLWNLHDQHSRDITHLISESQLGNLHGLLNIPVHVDLSQRLDRDVNDLVDDLQR